MTSRRHFLLGSLASALMASAPVKAALNLAAAASPNTWHHLMFARTTGAIKTFVDGKEEVTEFRIRDEPDGGLTVLIGNQDILSFGPPKEAPPDLLAKDFTIDFWVKKDDDGQGGWIDELTFIGKGV